MKFSGEKYEISDWEIIVEIIQLLPNAILKIRVLRNVIPHYKSLMERSEKNLIFFF